MDKIGYICMVTNGHTCSKSKDQPGKVANPARGQTNKENKHFPVHTRTFLRTDKIGHTII